MVFTFSYYNELTNHSASQMNDIWGRDRVYYKSFNQWIFYRCYSVIEGCKNIFFYGTYTGIPPRVLGAQKNRLNETVLLSTRNMRST